MADGSNFNSYNNQNMNENQRLKATTLEMANIEPIPMVLPEQIMLNNGEIPGNMIPPPHIIAMNGKIFYEFFRNIIFELAAVNLQKTSTPSSHNQQQLFCPVCKEIVITRVEKKVGDGTILVGGMLCICCGCLGCCLVPCLIDDCKDSIHFCSKCNHNFGIFSLLKL